MNSTEFKNRFPEFADVDNTRVELVLSEAALSVNPARWGVKAILGQMYLAAHLLTLATRGGSGVSGPVTSEKVGDLSRTYATASNSSGAEYASTGYGVEYLRLRKSILISPMVT